MSVQKFFQNISVNPKDVTDLKDLIPLSIDQDEDFQRFVDFFGVRNLIDKFLHGDINELDTKEVLHLLLVGIAGDKPVRRLADDAETRAVETLTGFLNLLQELDAMSDILVATMNNLTTDVVLTEIRQNLH